ncbi:MAG: cytochrome P450 [Parvibaculaceae bacterium]
MTTEAARLYDTAFWADPEAVHQLFASLRENDPVHFCEGEGYPDLWHITRHADIFEIERKTEVFLNEPRLIIMPTAREEAVRALTGGSTNLIRSLVSMDAPEHTKMRLLTQAWFMPKNLARLEDSITSSADKALQTLRSRNGECDFAKDIALEYPLRVIMKVLGVPSKDYPLMLRLTQELFGPDDPDTKRKDVDETVDPAAALKKTFAEFSAYFNEVTRDRRENPQDDVASIIANAEIDGEPISNTNALGYYIIVATAGHDTTSYSLSQAVYALATNPQLFERLKADPQEAAPKIVEEAIRIASPVRHFVRTARSDYEIGGKTIKAGQSAILWYPSGSRDETVFEDPDTFDIDRDRSVRHAAFGHGAHMCLGMHLARQENVRFLVQFAEQVDSLELTDAPKYMQAHFVGGIKNLPIRVRLSA